MTVRMGTEKDLTQLIALLRILTELEGSFDFDEKSHRDGLALIIGSQPLACVAVAESRGRIAGMCTGQTVFSTAMGGPSVWVEDMVVHPDFRRRGVASDLLAFLDSWAESRGARRQQLLIDNDNCSAMAFYRTAGWEGTNFSCLRKLR
jgi:GNAT superfamily N-acetyltransferase